MPYNPWSDSLIDWLLNSRLHVGTFERSDLQTCKRETFFEVMQIE